MCIYECKALVSKTYRQDFLFIRKCSKQGSIIICLCSDVKIVTCLSMGRKSTVRFYSSRQLQLMKFQQHWCNHGLYQGHTKYTGAILEIGHTGRPNGGIIHLNVTPQQIFTYFRTFPRHIFTSDLFSQLYSQRVQ